MRPALSSSRAISVAGLAMTVLLSILAVLQYRWLGEVSRAERERMLSRMQSSAMRFARDFDREVGRAFLLLEPDGPPGPGDPSREERRARWKASALFPDLVRAVFVAEPSRGGELRLSRLDEATGLLAPAEWPAELSVLKRRLEDPAVAERPGGGRRARPFPIADADAPALVTPFAAREPLRSGPARGDRRLEPPGGYAIVWLSRDVLEGRLLPELAARHFAAAHGMEYGLEVVSGAPLRRVLYRAGPAQPEGPPRRGDVEIGLLGVVHSEEREPGGEPRGPGGDREPPRDEPPGIDAGGAPLALPRSSPESPWRLMVFHPGGSLEAAVASARRRNLAVSFGTLLLLALGTTALLVSTRLAQRLARQQLEFTAGVTHELATPLAGMRSAAQNLADGVVRDPEQVRAYGALIDREGRRLTEMVDKVLAFAGMQSGRPALARQPVAIARVIEEALSGARRSLDERGFRVETDVAPDLPEVLGDGPALTRALENLVGNAAKYAADGAWLRVRAGSASTRRGREVQVTVEDRGPGIAPEDLPHVFEPFYRGRGRPAGAVAGSGLGLTLVRNIARAHGGRVAVTSGSGRGAAFTIHLPVRDAGSAS